eukprot:7889676-Alexandrium_andersonii.AAC.1
MRWHGTHSADGGMHSNTRGHGREWHPGARNAISVRGHDRVSTPARGTPASAGRALGQGLGAGVLRAVHRGRSAAGATGKGESARTGIRAERLPQPIGRNKASMPQRRVAQEAAELEEQKAAERAKQGTAEREGQEAAEQVGHDAAAHIESDDAGLVEHEGQTLHDATQ